MKARIAVSIAASQAKRLLVLQVFLEDRASFPTFFPTDFREARLKVGPLATHA